MGIRDGRFSFRNRGATHVVEEKLDVLFPFAPALRTLGRTSLLFLLLLQTTCSGDATGPEKTTIGAEGGTASLGKGAVTLLIPSGALATEVEFSATQTSSAPESHLLVAGSTWEIGPPETTFSKLVTVTLSYDPRNLPQGARETELGLFQARGINWQLALNPTVDTNAHTVSGRVMSLGTFGARGLSVATVEVSPTSYTLEQGQTKALTAVGQAASGMVLPERPVAWTSTDESVATVGPEGVVSAVGVGSAVIRATVEGASGSVEINS